MKRFAAALAFVLLAGCGGETQTRDTSFQESPHATPGDAPAVTELNAVAEAFVKLGLELGVYDDDYVDAYHGPPEWRAAAEASPRSLDDLAAAADALIARLDAVGEKGARPAMLRRQLVAARTRIAMASGDTFSFNEETKLLYDAVAPAYDLAEFDAALSDIDSALPGEGPLSQRVQDFRNSLAIPPDKLGPVFDAAIAECRRRTLEHYDLPAGENFTIGYVTDKPWSGYNWYQGGFVSKIEINTDFPVIIDRAVDLGCHEGYPGHHTWNVLVERDFVGANGWIEYSMYPLFSPQSLIGEGSANFGIELAFPGEEKTAFERDVLYPLAGLDPSNAEKLAGVNKARRKLSHARNHIAREYLDGRIGRETAIDMLEKYGLHSRERAEQSVRFIETYRGYVLNYNLGQDLVKAYVEAAGDDPWTAFERLLTTPLSASDLAAATGSGAAPSE